LIVLGCVIHADRGGLDRDTFLAFQIHGVEHLRGHVAFRDCAGELEQAVGKRRFAMINMSNNTKISNVVCHSCVREYNLFLTTKDTKEHEGFKEKERENSSSLAIFALSLALPATARRPRSVAEWEGRCSGSFLG